MAGLRSYWALSGARCLHTYTLDLIDIWHIIDQIGIIHSCFSFPQSSFPQLPLVLNWILQYFQPHQRFVDIFWRIAFFVVHFFGFAQHLNVKITPTILQIGKKTSLFLFVCLFSQDGKRFNGHGPQPAPLSKESEQFQSIDSNVIHISVPFLSFCCQLSVSVFSLFRSLTYLFLSFFLQRDKRLLLIAPVQSGPPPPLAVQDKEKEIAWETVCTREISHLIQAL